MRDESNRPQRIPLRRKRALAFLGYSCVSFFLVPSLVHEPGDSRVGQTGGTFAFSVGMTQIVDLARLEDGTIVVLGGTPPAHLRSFSGAGVPLDVAPSFGDGTGQLKGPTRLASEGPRLYVLDNGHKRVSVFRQGEGVFNSILDIGLEGRASDICVIGDRLFSLLLEGNDLVVEVDSTGVVVERFGKHPLPSEVPEEHDLRGPDPRLSVGLLECDPSRSQIVVIHTLLAIVAAFDFHGNEMWRTRLPGFLGTELKEYGDPRRCCAYLANHATGTFQYVKAAAIVGEGLVVTLAELDPKDVDRPLPDLTFRELSLMDGRLTRAGPLEAVLVLAEGGTFIGYDFETWNSEVIVGKQTDFFPEPGIGAPVL